MKKTFPDSAGFSGEFQRPFKKEIILTVHKNFLQIEEERNNPIPLMRPALA